MASSTNRKNIDAFSRTRVLSERFWTSRARGPWPARRHLRLSAGTASWARQGSGNVGHVLDHPKDQRMSRFAVGVGTGLAVV